MNRLGRSASWPVVITPLNTRGTRKGVVRHRGRSGTRRVPPHHPRPPARANREHRFGKNSGAGSSHGWISARASTLGEGPAPSWTVAGWDSFREPRWRAFSTAGRGGGWFSSSSPPRRIRRGPGFRAKMGRADRRWTNGQHLAARGFHLRRRGQRSGDKNAGTLPRHHAQGREVLRHGDPPASGGDRPQLTGASGRGALQDRAKRRVGADHPRPGRRGAAEVHRTRARPRPLRRPVDVAGGTRPLPAPIRRQSAHAWKRHPARQHRVVLCHHRTPTTPGGPGAARQASARGLHGPPPDRATRPGAPAADARPAAPSGGRERVTTSQTGPHAPVGVRQRAHLDGDSWADTGAGRALAERGEHRGAVPRRGTAASPSPPSAPTGTRAWSG